MRRPACIVFYELLSHDARHAGVLRDSTGTSMSSFGPKLPATARLLIDAIRMVREPDRRNITCDRRQHQVGTKHGTTFGAHPLRVKARDMRSVNVDVPIQHVPDMLPVRKR